MIFNSKTYLKEIEEYVKDNLTVISQLKNKKILITGAAGLIGSYLVDILMQYNNSYLGNIKIYALDINASLAKERFSNYFKDEEHFDFVKVDISKSLEIEEKIDYIIHAASNTSPIDYAKHPISTMNTNVIGNYNLLEFARKTGIERYMFCSSVEMYGLNNGDTDEFDELYSGYVDANTVRANYPSSKRACESMCQAYAEEANIDFVTVRIGRIYGPNVITGDTKAPTQFIFKALNNEDIVLKSDGMQEYSYCYVGDCAIAMLYVLVKGESRNAYNIADKNSRVLLKKFAKIAAESVGKNIVFDTMNETEKQSYSKVTKAVLSLDKLYSLGFTAKFDIYSGIPNTIQILKGE